MLWPRAMPASTTWESDVSLLKHVCAQAGFPQCAVGGQRCVLPQIGVGPEEVVPPDAFHYGPMLLQNLTQGWQAKEAWERQSLLHTYGAVEVKVGHPEIIADQGSKASNSSILLSTLLARWRDGERNLFLFQSDQTQNSGKCNSLACILNLASAEKAVEEFRVPVSLQSMDDLILSVGPSGQGLPLHAHGAAWQALMHGKKLWALLPPGEHSPDITLGLTVNTLLEKHSLGGTSATFCLQEPGEVIVVPHLWHHATMNIGDAISVGGQIKGEMLSALLKCLEPLVRQGQVESYASGFAICERRWEKQAKRISRQHA